MAFLWKPIINVQTCPTDHHHMHHTLVLEHCDCWADGKLNFGFVNFRCSVEKAATNRLNTNTTQIDMFLVCCIAIIEKIRVYTKLIACVCNALHIIFKTNVTLYQARAQHWRKHFDDSLCLKYRFNCCNNNIIRVFAVHTYQLQEIHLKFCGKMSSWLLCWPIMLADSQTAKLN